MILHQERFSIFIFYGIVQLFFCSCNKQRLEVDINKYNNYVNKAIQYNTNQQFDSAFYYFNKAKLACDESEMEKKNYCLFYIAQIEQQQSDFSGSEVTAIEALENNSQSIYLPNIYNQLGIAYAEQNDFKNAIKYYNKAYLVTDDLLYKALIKNNIAVIYLEGKNYSNAIKTLEPLLQDESVKKSETDYAKIIDNLGYAYFKSNNPIAIDFLNKAVKIREEKNLNFELIASYLHLSEYYVVTNFDLSLKYAKLGYENATKCKSVADRITALKFLVQNSDGITSQKYAIQQILLSDSITTIRQKSKTQFAKIKYDASKAEKETESQKKYKQIYFLLFLLTTMIALFSFFLIRSKNKRKIVEEKYNTETELSKKLHDELANHVFHSITYAQTQDLTIYAKKEVLLSELDEIYNQIRDFSRVTSTIPTGENFEKIVLEMLSDFNSHAVKVIIKKEFIDWKKISPEKKIALYRLLLELMVNMKKHSQCSFVIIKFKNHDKTIIIDYHDNGIGDANQLFIAKGLQNAENRIKTINGTIIFDSDNKKGFKLTISFPK